MKKIIKSKYKGTTIEIKLPEECGREGYSVECTYRYDNNNEKYLLSIWLKRDDIDSKFKIQSQEVDTQYITSNKYTITRDICTLVEHASLIGFFEEYILRYEYEQKCFERGNELFEQERLNNTDDKK